MGQEASRSDSPPVLGLLPWSPQLGKPLGKIQLDCAWVQDCLLFSLPLEIVKLILHLTQPGNTPRETGPSLLATCRSGYQLFAPLCKWLDVHDYHETAVGNFILRGNDGETTGYAIRRDGSFRARYRRPPLDPELFAGVPARRRPDMSGRDEIFVGTWSLQPDRYSPHVWGIMCGVLAFRTKAICQLVFSPKTFKIDNKNSDTPRSVSFNLFQNPDARMERKHFEFEVI